MSIVCLLRLLARQWVNLWMFHLLAFLAFIGTADSNELLGAVRPNKQQDVAWLVNGTFGNSLSSEEEKTEWVFFELYAFNCLIRCRVLRNFHSWKVNMRRHLLTWMQRIATRKRNLKVSCATDGLETEFLEDLSKLLFYPNHVCSKVRFVRLFVSYVICSSF